jgi:hypothetical protein
MQHGEDVNSSEVAYKFNTIPFKIPAGCFKDRDKQTVDAYRRKRSRKFQQRIKLKGLLYPTFRLTIKLR